MKKSLGDRMKGYEHINRDFLMRRVPVIIRLDGKAFHTYTKGCSKPYDYWLHQVRKDTLKYLCENIQGCIIGYSQSDEISLVLKDWQTFNTCAWFDNNLLKLVSVSASMCTMKWNLLAVEYSDQMSYFDFAPEVELTPTAVFDSRAFNLPKEEVVNYLVWRQQDWERNSIQMLAQSLYSQKELNGLSCSTLITKVEEEHSIVWGDLEPWKKQGEIWTQDKGLVDNMIFKDHRTSLEAIINVQEEI